MFPPKGKRGTAGSIGRAPEISDETAQGQNQKRLFSLERKGGGLGPMPFTLDFKI